MPGIELSHADTLVFGRTAADFREFCVDDRSSPSVVDVFDFDPSTPMSPMFLFPFRIISHDHALFASGISLSLSTTLCVRLNS